MQDSLILQASLSLEKRKKKYFAFNHLFFLLVVQHVLNVIKHSLVL